MKHWKTLLFAFLCAPTLAFAIGAIAVDDEAGSDTDDIGYGIFLGGDTKAEATRGAMKECKKAGNENCKVVAWFEPCGAYAVSKRYYGVGWGESKKKAESMALEKCGHKNCAVVVSECE